MNSVPFEFVRSPVKFNKIQIMKSKTERNYLIFFCYMLYKLRVRGS